MNERIKLVEFIRQIDDKCQESELKRKKKITNR